MIHIPKRKGILKKGNAYLAKKPSKVTVIIKVISAAKNTTTNSSIPGVNIKPVPKPTNKLLKL
jgi:hypothetical protein